MHDLQRINFHVVMVILQYQLLVRKLVSFLPSRGCCLSSATVCDSNFWLDLNYLVVAKAAQSCSAHFTALLYTEIYVDKIKANMEENCRYDGKFYFVIFFLQSVSLFLHVFLTKCAEPNPERHAKSILKQTVRPSPSPV